MTALQDQKLLLLFPGFPDTQREQLGFLLPFTEFYGKHDKGKAKEALPAHLERNAGLCQQIPSARLPQTSPVSALSVEDKEERGFE